MAKVTIDQREQDGVTVLAFTQKNVNITEENVHELGSDLLNAAQQADPPKVVLDLGNVEFFGSSFIESMFLVWKALSAKDGRFAICQLHPYCETVLSVTNLTSVWEIHPSVEEAVAALK